MSDQGGKPNQDKLWEAINAGTLAIWDALAAIGGDLTGCTPSMLAGRLAYSGFSIVRNDPAAIEVVPTELGLVVGAARLLREQAAGEVAGVTVFTPDAIERAAAVVVAYVATELMAHPDQWGLRAGGFGG